MRQFDLISVFVQVFMAVVRADGEIHPAELEVIRRFFESSFDYGTHEMASVEREIEFCCQSDLQQRIDYILALLPLPEVLRELVVDCAVDIALADGRLDESEIEVLLELAARLSLSPEHFDLLEKRLRNWRSGAVSEVERAYLKLGLPAGAGLDEIESRFAELRSKYQNEQLPALGEEYAILGRRRLCELTIHYERLMTSLGDDRSKGTPNEPSLEEMGFLASTIQKLKGLGLKSSGPLTSLTTVRDLIAKGVPVDELAAVGKLRRPQGRGDSDVGRGIRESLVASVQLYLAELIESKLYAAKVPVKTDQLRGFLVSRCKGITPALVTSALVQGERQGLFFDCGQCRWTLVKFLELPSATVQKLWRLALQEVSERRAPLQAYELGWRQEYATLATVRVDFALKNCPGLKRMKPGVYVRADAIATQVSDGGGGARPVEPLNPANHPIENLPLQTGTKNTLIRAGLRTVSEVVKRGPRRLCSATPGFGPVAWRDLEVVLRKFAREHGLLQVLEPFFAEGSALAATARPKDSRSASDGELVVGGAARVTIKQALKCSLSEVDFRCLWLVYGPGDSQSKDGLLPENISQASDICDRLRLDPMLSILSVQIQDFCESRGGWTGLTDLAELDCLSGPDNNERLFSLRVLAAVFEDFALFEKLGVFTTIAQRLKLLMDQKHRAVKELPAPRRLEEVVEWLAEQFVDLTKEQALRVIIELWNVYKSASGPAGKAVLVAYGEPSEADELAGLLLGEVDGITLEGLVGMLHESEPRFPLYASEIRSVIQSHPETFVQVGDGRYSLWANFAFSASEWCETLKQLSVVLWSAGIATNERWVLGYFHRHGHTQPWLNEYSVSSLLGRYPDILEKMEGGFVRPLGSGYLAPEVTQLVIESIVVSRAALSVEEVEAGVRSYTWCTREDLERALAQACLSQRIMQIGDRWAMIGEGVTDL